MRPARERSGHEGRVHPVLSITGSRDAVRTEAKLDEDATLVARACSGEAGAFEAIYLRHHDAIFNLVLRLLGDSHEAEDVVQDTFTEMLETLSQLREPGRLAPWLRRIAVFRVHRRFRRRQLRRRLGFLPAVPDASLEALASPDATPEVMAELALLDRRIEKLKADERVVWMLRFVEGLTLPEVAEATGWSLSTVKRRLERSRAEIGRPHLAEVALP